MPFGLPDKRADDMPTKDAYGSPCWLPLTVQEQREALNIIADMARMEYGAHAAQFINKRRARIAKQIASREVHPADQQDAYA